MKSKPRARRRQTLKRRNRRRMKPGSIMKPQLDPVNRTQYIVLKYSDGYFGTTGVPPSLAGIQWKINSLYDVQGSLTVVNNTQGTLGGHQPYGFDDIKTLYDYVHVYKVKISVKCMHTNYTASVLTDSGINSTVPTNFTLQCERPGCKMVVTSGNGDAKTITKTFYLHRIIGITLQEYLGNDSYGQDPNSPTNPIIPIYANLLSQAIDLSAHVHQSFVDIQFFCKFRGKKLLSQS